MKSLLALCCAFLLIGCGNNGNEKNQLTTHRDSVSYSLGIDLGRRLITQQVDVEKSMLIRGMSDVIDSLPLAVNDEAMGELLRQFEREMRDKMNAKLRATMEKNKKESEDFMAQNKTREGVVTLASGLQYKVLTTGKGPKPKANQTVTFHYRGTFVDGTEFDNSYKRGEPAVSPIGRMMKGWAEGLQLMPVGSKWMLFVPPALAYGERGSGGTIPPFATLIFEVELLSIE